MLGLVGVAIGGYTLTKFLTRNVRKIRGGVVLLQKFDEPPIVEPLSE